MTKGELIKALQNHKLGDDAEIYVDTESKEAKKECQRLSQVLVTGIFVIDENEIGLILEN